MNESQLGEMFPERPSLPEPTKEDLSGIKFKGSHLHLEVYHLMHGTKKLRACTYRRMRKRQDRINKKKAKQLLPRSPEDQEIRAEKKAWLSKVEKLIETENLQQKGALTVFRKNKKKKIRKSKKKLANKI